MFESPLPAELLLRDGAVAVLVEERERRLEVGHLLLGELGGHACAVGLFRQQLQSEIRDVLSVVSLIIPMFVQ